MITHRGIRVLFKRLEIGCKRLKWRFNPWVHAGVSVRRYKDYGEYIEHQRSKFWNTPKKASAVEVRTKTERIRANLAGIEQIKGKSSVLCLAARSGEEVAAFIKLGFFAVGIDVEPGHGNRFVVHGDFHHLQYANGSVDVVYCNALDHCLALDEFANEVRRVLKLDGVFVCEIMDGHGEGRPPGEYETMTWPAAVNAAYLLAKVGRMEIVLSREASMKGWKQFIMRVDGS